MPKGPRYAVLGRGRWAGRMLHILKGEGRPTLSIEETRRRVSESDSNYKSRLSSSILASGAQIAWLCVPPGPHIPLMLEAAMDAGLHAVAEKPWFCSREQTERLFATARARHLLIGVHYEYCLLDSVDVWRRDFYPGIGLRFGGCFTLSRPQRSAISALDDLGSHLLAIRAYSVPQSEVCDLRCGYQLPDERRVWLESTTDRVASIDFLENHEPIIQRFIARFEAAVHGGEFPFGLEFASRVADDIRALK